MSKLSFLEHACSNGWLLAHAPTVLLCQSSLLLFLIDIVAIPTCLRVSSYVWMLTPQRYQHISALILQTINEIKSLLTLKQPLSPSPPSLPLGLPVYVTIWFAPFHLGKLRRCLLKRETLMYPATSGREWHDCVTSTPRTTRTRRMSAACAASSFS